MFFGVRVIKEKTITFLKYKGLENDIQFSLENLASGE